MNDKRLVTGVVIFLIGGAVLAFGDGGAAATGLGTTGALAGLVLAGWGWLGGRETGD